MKLLTILLAPIVAVGMASTALARDYKDLRLFFAPCALSKTQKTPFACLQIYSRNHSVVIIFTLLSVLAADLRGRGSPQIDLLGEFRPIGGSGNNRESPDLDLEETPLTSAAINILVPTGSNCSAYRAPESRASIASELSRISLG